MLVLNPPPKWKFARHLAFASAEHLVAVYGAFGAARFDLPHANYAGTFQYRIPYHGLVVAPTCGWCWLPAAYNGLIRLRYPDLVPLRTGSEPDTDNTLFAAASPDGRRLVYGPLRADSTSGWRDGLGGFTCAGNLVNDRWTRFERGWEVLAVAFLPVGERIVSLDRGGRFGARRLAIRSADSGDILQEFACPGKEAEELAVSSNGQMLAVRAGRAVWVWDGPDWGTAKPRKVSNDSPRRFTSIAFHPSGRFLAATDNAETVKFFDTTSWEIAKTFTWNLGKLYSLVFSPDGMLAAAGSDTGRIVVWDMDL